MFEDDFTQGGSPTPDYLFTSNNPDGDGVDNDVDLDDNNDGISDIEQGLGVDPGADADGDNIPNYLDVDFIHPSLGVFVDSNNDGINDIFDADRDGIPNHFDLDSDNDGIPNAVEANGGVLPANMTENGQFTVAYALANDSDNDGLINDVDVTTGGSALSTDTDSDGIDDYLDSDSDGDGITDAIEAGAQDTNGDGFNDTFNNSDSDGLPDYRDVDSDGDGITDLVEAQPTLGAVGPAGIDTDNDGIDDNFDSDNGGTDIDPNDADTDGIPDYRDTDSDNDTVLDITEGHDANADGIADRGPSGFDTDGDGLDNAYDTDNGGTVAPTQNSNILNEVDYRDADDDGDSIPTKDETADLSPANGTPDYLEASTDACGNRLVTITGNAIAIALNNGVTNTGNSLGASDFDGTTGTTSTLQTGDFYILDLGEFLPSGSILTVSLFITTNSQVRIGKFGFNQFIW